MSNIGLFSQYLSANTVLSFNDTSAISGVRDLKLEKTSNNFGGILLVNTYAKGFTRGRIRTLWKPVSSTHTEEGLVITSMQTNANLLTTASNFYMLRVTSNRISIQKFTNQLITTAGTELAGSAITSTSGTSYAIEFEWFVNAAATSINLVARRATSTSFSSLAEVLNYTDSSSPFVTSSAEGFGAIDSATGQPFEHRFDNFAAFRVNYQV